MTKRLLCVYQHAPTPGAPGIYRHRELFAELVRRGWQVDLVSTPRNYMSGEVPRAYRHRPIRRELIDGIHHHWVWTPGAIHRSRLRRVLNYAVFAAAACLRAAALPRPDVVYVSSPPLSVAPLGLLLGSRFRRPWVLEVRDIWPESAAAVGWLPPDGPLYRGVDRLARAVTKSADGVVVPTPGLEPLVRGHGASSVVLVPGSVTERELDPRLRARARHALGIGDEERVFLYLGSIGVANGLDLLVEAMQILERTIRARILVVGDGSARDAFERSLAAAKVDRVTLLPAVSKDGTADLLAAADVGLHLLRRDPVFESALPTKVLEYLGAGLPFVTTVPGLPARIANESGGALAVSAHDLAAELRRWSALPDDEVRARGRTARAYGVAHFGLRLNADRLEELLRSVSYSFDRPC